MVLISKKKVYPGVTNPAVFEALACREAQALALDLNISNLVVASESYLI
jgi:hypothetical protein